jgi:hypothetical protein
MAFMTLLFSEEELKTLDENERQLLRGAILEQIQTSPELNDIVKKMLKKDDGQAQS